MEASLNEVDPGVIEAAKSMGASTWQIIVKVLLPEAKPSLITNGAIAVTTILGYSAMAGFCGAGGLEPLPSTMATTGLRTASCGSPFSS